MKQFETNYKDTKEAPAVHTALLMVLYKQGELTGHEYVSADQVRTYEKQGYSLCSEPEILEHCLDLDAETL